MRPHYRLSRTVSPTVERYVHWNSVACCCARLWCLWSTVLTFFTLDCINYWFSLYNVQWVCVCVQCHLSVQASSVCDIRADLGWKVWPHCPSIGMPLLLLYGLYWELLNEMSIIAEYITVNRTQKMKGKRELRMRNRERESWPALNVYIPVLGIMYLDILNQHSKLIIDLGEHWRHKQTHTHTDKVAYS